MKYIVEVLRIAALRIVALCIAAFVCLTPLVRAEEVVLECLQDAELDEEEPDTNKGAGADIMIGATWGEPELLRAYGLFEFDGLMTSPEYDIVVNQAIVKLSIVGNSNDAEADIYVAAESWNETTVTWNSRPAENRDIVVTDTAPPLEPPVQPWEIDVTEIVRTWYEPDPPQHHGLYIDIPDNGQWVDIDVASRDHPDTSLHPRLQIDYDVVGISEEDETFDNSFTVTQVSPGFVEINCNLPHASPAILKVYDASGALAKSLTVERGNHSILWHALPGVYFVRLQAGTFGLVKKIVII